MHQLGQGDYFARCCVYAYRRLMNFTPPLITLVFDDKLTASGRSSVSCPNDPGTIFSDFGHLN